MVAVREIVPALLDPNMAVAPRVAFDVKVANELVWKVQAELGDTVVDTVEEGVYVFGDALAVAAEEFDVLAFPVCEDS